MSEMLEAYIAFVKERHRIWERRQAGEPAPWTKDPVLAGRKFCNMFRVLDHGSQFVVKELLYGGARDVLMRCFLYRFTNRPEPWEFFHDVTGDYPDTDDLRTGSLKHIWTSYAGPRFGSAYQIHVGLENPGVDKTEFVIGLARRTFIEEEFFSFADWLTADQAERHALLMRVPRVGSFLAMQMLTDFGYSAHGGEGFRDLEDEFVAEGPGSARGAALLSPGKETVDVIENLTSMWYCEHSEPALSLGDGTHRLLSLMDVQNSLCEFDKYIRVGTKKQKLTPYSPKHVPEPPVLPAHWKGTEL